MTSGRDLVQDNEAYRRAVSLTGLPDGLPTGVVLDNGERVCLVRRGDRVWAVHDVCPHRAFALSGGDCVAVAGQEAPVIECPWHGARFSCADGAVLQGPATDALPTFPVRIVGGEVLVGARRDAAPSHAPQPHAPQPELS